MIMTDVREANLLETAIDLGVSLEALRNRMDYQAVLQIKARDPSSYQKQMDHYDKEYLPELYQRREDARNSLSKFANTEILGDFNERRNRSYTIYSIEKPSKWSLTAPEKSEIRIFADTDINTNGVLQTTYGCDLLDAGEIIERKSLAEIGMVMDYMKEVLVPRLEQEAAPVNSIR